MDEAAHSTAKTRPSMDDVAAAGVSTSTVSRSLPDDPESAPKPKSASAKPPSPSAIESTRWLPS
ncbi:LacI family DNA-binding transcriptional regulator [Pelagicoccus enzymogenes]|uniref:hypothetical protein n=1 Tax=Pelagicoccus enzymogenes TaxID=2773457 RepID=UPI00280EAD16|nr:hypothetical protein [Pelagicoccus enzymogenes]MDQ8196808.1 LacI family DNA-binding transcriptional regulator [Pelagicoccus enzymogenes]